MDEDAGVAADGSGGSEPEPEDDEDVDIPDGTIMNPPCGETPPPPAMRDYVLPHDARIDDLPPWLQYDIKMFIRREMTRGLQTFIGLVTRHDLVDWDPPQREHRGQETCEAGGLLLSGRGKFPRGLFDRVISANLDEGGPSRKRLPATLA